MSREKQIEEMAFDLCMIDRCKHLPQAECDNTTCVHCEAEALYNAGYRKASEVAAEIFAEIEKEIRSNIKTILEIKDDEEGGWYDGELNILGMLDNNFAILKKKYTESAGEGL